MSARSSEVELWCLSSLWIKYLCSGSAGGGTSNSSSFEGGFAPLLLLLAVATPDTKGWVLCSRGGQLKVAQAIPQPTFVVEGHVPEADGQGADSLLGHPNLHILLQPIALP